MNTKAQNAGGQGTLHSSVTTYFFALLLYSLLCINYQLLQRQNTRLEKYSCSYTQKPVKNWRISLSQINNIGYVGIQIKLILSKTSAMNLNGECEFIVMA